MNKPLKMNIEKKSHKKPQTNVEKIYDQKSAYFQQYLRQKSSIKLKNKDLEFQKAKTCQKLNRIIG